MYLLSRVISPHMVTPTCLGQFDNVLPIGVCELKQEVVTYAESRLPEKVKLEKTEWVNYKDQLIRLIIIRPDTSFELYLWEIIAPIPDVTIQQEK